MASSVSYRSFFKEDNNDYLNHVCGECENCEPYMRWETLTVQDRKPTMGVCPHVKDRKVLLSEQACKKFGIKKVKV